MVNLTSQTQGRIKGIFFQPGDTISAGQTILELDNEIEQARVAQASARLEVQRPAILAAQAGLAAARIRAENAGRNLGRVRNLFEQKAATQEDYDNAESEYNALAEEAKQFEAEVLRAEKLIDQYQADLRLAEAEWKRTYLVAPADGQLLSLDEGVGSLIAPEKPVGTFALKSPLVARCEIDELFAPKIRAEQSAYLRSEGMADTLATGMVSFVGPYLRRKSIFSDDVGVLEDRRVREIWIRLDSREGVLLGQRVECVIMLSTANP
jgi:multidrug resistance efflux pump